MFEASQRYVPLSVLFRLLMNRLGPDSTACWGISSSTLTQVTITGLQRKREKDRLHSYFPLRCLHQTSHPRSKWITRRVSQLKRTYWRYFKFTELQLWSLQKSCLEYNFLKKLSGIKKLSTDHKQESHYFQLIFNRSADKPMCPSFMPCCVVSHQFRQDRAHPLLIISLIKGKKPASWLVIHAFIWCLLTYQDTCLEDTCDI